MSQGWLPPPQKGSAHGVDKYAGNPLHFIESIPWLVWTATVPDKCATVEQAVAQCKDQATIVIRQGFYAWSTPIEVRKRLDVVGEPGTVLSGTWFMDEGSGGGTFREVTCVAAAGRCFHITGGSWAFERCSLRGYGEGSCVLFCSSGAELVVRSSSVCGVHTSEGYRHPYTCVQCVGDASVVIEDCKLADAAGYGVSASDEATARVTRSLLTGHGITLSVSARADFPF